MSTPTTIYLIRHAQSEMNVQNHLIGGRSTETPLTEKGIEQARTLGRFLLRERITPSHVLSSPAVRTRETARHALAEMGVLCDLSIHDDLHEMGQGQWVGRPRAEVYTDAVKADIARLGKDFKLDGGESMNEVGLRMLNYLTANMSDNPGDEPLTYLVFTHGLAIRCLVSHLFDWTHEQTFTTSTPNTSVTRLSYGGKRWNLDYFARVPEPDTNFKTTTEEKLHRMLNEALEEERRVQGEGL